jgi:AcrR family transcriptional regulator
MKMTRSYTMTSRAQAAEATRVRILDAVADLAGERMVADISLDLVAQRADVSVQTVLRRFGSRAGLFDEAQRHAESRILDERHAPVGDIDAALRAIVDHYELRGDAVLLMLAQERTEPLMAAVTTSGKDLHRQWVARTFAPSITAARDPEELTDLLVVATDVYCWKLLRRDRGLDRRLTEQRMARLVRALLDTHRPVGTHHDRT